jgi:hypothetical protein
MEIEKTNEEVPHMDSDASYVASESELENATGVAGFVHSAFHKARANRLSDEQRWLKAYRNFRGLYGKDVQFTEAEKSRVFIKVTKTKVLAAYGQIVDIMFGSVRFPISISPTTIPEGIAEAVHLSMNPQADNEVSKSATRDEEQGDTIFTPDLKLRPGETRQSLQDRLGAEKNKLTPVSDMLVEGAGTTNETITYHPALVSAKKMEKKILDQLEESQANTHMRNALFELVLFGTGIVKGPFAVNKELPNWSDDGKYEPVSKVMPSISFTSIWNFYPDPESNTMDESEYVIERHKMSRHQLRSLKKRPMFSSDAIEACINKGPNYVKEHWETEMEDSNTESTNTRFEVLEYWGYVGKEELQKETNFKIPKEYKDKDQVNVNIWVCNGEVLRMAVNPFTPMRLPYQAAPFEANPYGFFGIGMAENMDDSQTLMNGFMRMAVDNAVLSGNLIFEVDETYLVPGQDLDFYPGKVFRRSGEPPGS